MTTLITLTKKADSAEVSGRKGEVVKAVRKLGANGKPVTLDRVKKTMGKMDPKLLRFHVRNLQEDKLISVKKTKEAEKKSA